MSRTGSTQRILRILKSQLVEFCLGRRRLAFACSPKPGQWPCGGCHTCWRGGGGADGKVIIDRLCISLPYVETFNSKVIKGFVPELRSRYVFFVCRDSYVLCIYVMNILCTFRISVSGYGTSLTPSWVCFNPSLKRSTCLAILKSFDTTKQSVFGWNIYIYIYIYIYILKR